MAKLMVTGLLLQMLGALLLTWLAMQTNGLSTLGRAGFVTVAAVTRGVLGEGPNWNWWGFSTCYTLQLLADLAIGWFLAGLAIAWATKER